MLILKVDSLYQLRANTRDSLEQRMSLTIFILSAVEMEPDGNGLPTVKLQIFGYRLNVQIWLGYVKFD